MKEMRRVLALVLCAVMLVGYVPVGAIAAEAETTVPSVTEEVLVTEAASAAQTGAAEEEEILFDLGSISVEAVTGSEDKDYLFIATDRHTNTSIIGNIINNMESAIGENELDYLALGGDMVGSGSTHPAYNSSTVLGEVTGATSSLSAENVDIVAGIHDMKVNDDAGIVLPYQGGGAQIYEGDRFYVYGVEEYCISDDSNESNWSAQVSAFKTWANGADIDKSKVIIVVSHYPLHAKRDDNDGAYYWHQALNTVATGAASGDATVERNIVFFHGHNHTVDSNEYVYNVGDTMSIQNGSSTTSDTIYYTYATAGYLKDNSKATLVTITDSSIDLTKYSTSGSGTAMTETLERVVEAATVERLDVDGKTDWSVGETFVAPTVTACYSDGTYVTLTADQYQVTGTYDMNTAGVYSLTYSYGGVSKVYTFAVSAPYLDGVALTSAPAKLTYVTGEELDTTGMVVTATWSNGTTEDITSAVTLSGYDMSTAGTQTVKVSYTKDGVTYNNMSFTITVEDAAAEGVTLEKIEIAQAPAKTEYLLSEELKLDGMVVVATFSDGSTREVEYAPFSTSTVYGGYELDNFSMYVEKAHEVKVTYTYGGVTCTATTTINVWNENFSDETTGITVHVTGDYGVTAASVAESANENVATAIDGLIIGDNYQSWDISLVFDEGYSITDAPKTVTLPIPEGIENPVVYYVSDSGKSVVDMEATKTEDGKYVTFTTTHFSTYVVGEGVKITVPDNETATGSGSTTTTTTKTVYVLTSTPSGSVMIVNGNSAGSYYALANNSGSVAATGVTIKSGDVDGDGDTETYIELDDAADELWTVGGSSNSYTFKNGSYYLYSRSSGLRLDTSSRNWTYSSNRLVYSNRYLRYNNGWTQTTSSSSATSIYFYIPTEVEVETTTTVSGTYSIDGQDETVAAVENATVDLSSILTFTPTNGNVSTEDVSATATYEIVTVDADGNTVNGDPLGVISGIDGNVVTLSGKTGKALVKVSYTTAYGVVTDYITIEATTPHHYGIQLHKAEMTKVTETTYKDGVSYYIFDRTTGVYEFYGAESLTAEEFAAMVNAGELFTTPVTAGDEITAPVALKGVQPEQTYSIWAIVKAYTGADDTEGMDLGTLGDSLSWSVSDESIATIDTDTGLITFTGDNYGTFDVTVYYEGADGVIYEDTITISVTESLYIVPGDGTNDFPEYPAQGAVRFDKTATAVGNFSETGTALVEISMTGVPFTTGNELDVVIMLDMTGSMDDVTSSTSKPTGYVRVDASIAASKAFISTIVKNEDGSYNGNRVGVYVFNKNGAATLYAFDAVANDTELDAIYSDLDSIYADHYASGGTPYDDGLQKCYEVLAAAKTDGTGNDRQQFCVFMTDGVPTSYEYVTGTGHANYSSATSIAGMLTSASNYATRDTDYYYEYYSTEMKKAGVTVYSVGVGLFNENNAWSGTATQCGNLASALLNDISGPAGETSQPDAVGTSTLSKKDSYFFSVEDANAATEMEKVFKNIAQKILDAATDVRVEDKVGNNYSVALSLPDGLTSDHTDGLEDFYIQVVEYTLNADKERTGDPAVLENFTFDGETGALLTHTVDGVVTCEGTDCDHVTIADGAVTRIEGTYFTYENVTDAENEEENGEYLFWETDKITTTELALQYFAHLDDSTGTGAEGQIPAGTYYTNEYANMTYKNFKGSEVQVEFPVPQLTWNGAQVSYVFYLVNDAGQPVNSAGRVVPFAEAIYVTDVNTYSVVWNDMEQSAGLEAERLADDLVPTVYELYDKQAAYSIHVYEDESEINLNNHFVISGDAAYAAANSGKNANTTVVFNNKSDSTKYSAYGAYVADDGDTDTGETGRSYFCKSAIIEGATWTSKVENDVTVYTVTGLGSGYQAVDGEIQTTVAQITTAGGTTTGGTIFGDYIYYVDENGDVYTIVTRQDGKEVHKGFDFSNTTVAFAVKWKPELKEDTVVVDYGLDAVVNVITNDAMAAGVVGVRADSPAGVAINGGTYTAQKAQSADLYINANHDKDNLKELLIGTATVENMQSVRFSLNDANAMQFSDPAVFYYEADVNYYNTNSELVTTSMYSSVTVIPATTVYYEDNFLTLSSYSKNGEEWSQDEQSQWTSSSHSGKVQDVDRPGIGNIDDSYDADNPYGYDSAYSNMTTHSLGSSAMITVNGSTYGEATFTFYGTGFDVVSMTSNDTGTITVEVYEGAQATGTAVKTLLVDTYYGYDYLPHKVTLTYTTSEGWKDNAVLIKAEDMGTDQEKPDKPVDGSTYTIYEYRWVPSANTPNALYQVPVMKVSGLDYKQYTVKITAAYGSFFDHDKAGSYDLYLDAIRIYDPTGNQNTTANNAYVKDKEGWPIYEEIRDNIIKASGVKVTNNGDGTFTVTPDTAELTGAIFIDSNDEATSIEEYVNYGPNNEVYLAAGQSITFKVPLSTLSNVADVQLGMKSATGTAAKVTMNIKQEGEDDYTGTGSLMKATTTDLYYSIGSNIKDLTKDATITLTNSGDEGTIASITNLKLTFSQEPETNNVELGEISSQEAGAVLTMLYQRTAAAESQAKPEAELDVAVREKSVKVGKTVSLQATTSADVDYLLVNGQKVTKFTENRTTGKRTWSVSFKAEEAGTLNITVTACTADGTALETVTETVTVTAKKNGAVQQIVGQLIGTLGR